MLAAQNALLSVVLAASLFKLYLSDIGMLMPQYHTDVVLAEERSVSFGGAYGNVVAKELSKGSLDGVSAHVVSEDVIGAVLRR